MPRHAPFGRFRAFARDYLPPGQAAIAALFALSCFCFGALARQPESLPRLASLFAALASGILSYILIALCERLGREPHEPDLTNWALGCAVAQILVSGALLPPLIAVLLPQWLAAYALTRDLHRRPIAYLTARAAFAVSVALHACASDQLVMQQHFSAAIIPLLLCVAMVTAAIALTAPPQSWGSRAANLSAAGAIAAGVALASLAFFATGAPATIFLPASLAGAGAFMISVWNAERPTPKVERAAQVARAAWASVTFFSLGIGPYFARHALGI